MMPLWKVSIKTLPDKGIPAFHNIFVWVGRARDRQDAVDNANGACIRQGHIPDDHARFKIERV